MIAVHTVTLQKILIAPELCIILVYMCLCVLMHHGNTHEAGGCYNRMSINTMFIDRELHIKKLVLFISKYVVWKCI